MPRASASGPLYDRIYEGYTYDEIQRVANSEPSMDDEILTPRELEVIDQAFKRYRGNSGQALAKSSRSETPWKKARKRSNAQAGEDSQELITAKSMRKFFSEK